jgi:type II restriction/modification system DNA methylase subunit YeeA
MGMLITPEQFVDKWSHSKLSEKSASHQHFIDLCHLLHEPLPSDEDLDGSSYTFEKGVSKTTGRHGWADVWKRKCFGWEYKAHHKNLDEAYAQLQQYAPALENPPLLIVSDMKDIEIHTNWTNVITDIIKIKLTDLLSSDYRNKLQWAFEKPDKLRPDKTRAQITEEIANEFACIADKIRARGYNSERIAHFLNKLIFCMFAEDIGLLPNDIFTELVKSWLHRPNDGVSLLKQLFSSMRKGDYFGVNKIDWFNGGLFEEADDAIPLQKNEIALISKACDREWHDIDPVIFGNLFERSLAEIQSKYKVGVHYTDAASINKIIKPVIVDPLENEWSDVKDKLNNIINKAKRESSTKNEYFKQAESLYKQYLDKIRKFIVFDPSCGSGNFLNLALQELKNFEHKIILEGEKLGFHKELPQVGPHNVMGIDINLYATELAKVSIWICDLQWMLKHGYWISKNPILKKLENIQTRDALLNEDGTEASWPDANVIVGNPPFLGAHKLLSLFGEEYTKRLRHAFKGRLPGRTDLVTYWIDKARLALIHNKATRAGFVATNSICGGSNRTVLDNICRDLRLYNAWSDLDWVIEGASVRVSIINFSRINDDFCSNAILDGKPVPNIYPDLRPFTQDSADITKARIILQNKHISFKGTIKSGAFDIAGDLAREWLLIGNNPNKRSNSDVVKLYHNGFDIVRRQRDMWIVDFGESMSQPDASLYELPFEHVLKTVKHVRENCSFPLTRKKSISNWWLFYRPGPSLRKAIAPLSRYIATSIISKHRIFVWLDKRIIPDSAIIIIARDDDTTFGILHSKIHELWSLKLCTWLGVGNDPRYTPSSTFETFPFPQGLTPDTYAKKYENDPKAKAIAEAARELNDLRENWLNPSDLIKKIPEVVPGYPDRIIPINDQAAKELKKRTLTNLYNNKPQWLINAHKKLDDAVANAYGWEADLSDEEILKRLLELNLQRSK